MMGIDALHNQAYFFQKDGDQDKPPHDTEKTSDPNSENNADMGDEPDSEVAGDLEETGLILGPNLVNYQWWTLSQVKVAGARSPATSFSFATQSNCSNRRVGQVKPKISDRIAIANIH